MSNEKTYRLINPNIKGSMATEVSALNDLQAASKLYSNFSSYLKLSIPNFIFSIQEGGSSDINKANIHSFYVKETINGNDVEYSIEKYNGEHNFDKFTRNYTSFNNKNFTSTEEPNISITNTKSGGAKSKRKYKKKKSKKLISLDDDDSSSSSSYYPPLRYKYANYYDPIYYWWYDPTLYYLKRTYVPLFVDNLYPYILINSSP